MFRFVTLYNRGVTFHYSSITQEEKYFTAIALFKKRSYLSLQYSIALYFIGACLSGQLHQRKRPNRGYGELARLVIAFMQRSFPHMLKENDDRRKVLAQPHLRALWSDTSGVPVGPVTLCGLCIIWVKPLLPH